MIVESVEALPVAMPLPADYSFRAGPFRFAGFRSAVVVKVTTRDGIVGWGEAMNARSTQAIATLINRTLGDLVVGEDASAVNAIWDKVYRSCIKTSGADAGFTIGLSGIDMALWDIRGKAASLPLYRLLGGRSSKVKAYAGGLSLGFEPPEKLAEEALGLVEQGFRALKLRAGDTLDMDIARARKVRESLPDSVSLMIDANTLYSLEDCRIAAPRFAEMGFLWLEEPFPPHNLAAYRRAGHFANIALAAGENHFTRYDFHELLNIDAIAHVQPDLSKCGGITEALRIASMASARHVPLSPHSASTSLNYAASIHLLSAIDNPGWFEADASAANPLHHDIGTKPYEIEDDGTVRPLEGPGIGVEIDEDRLRAHVLTN
ncbi:mandelate racemase/muconate lactonizing enzyme family protein [Hoeflea sp. CAU 1731]